MTQQDFVTQILAAEEEAKAEVSRAEKKSLNDLNQYENSLVKQRENKLKVQREKFREKLKERQAKAKTQYEEAIAEGAREASQLKKDTEGKIVKQMPTAQAYFLNELIG